MPRSICHACRQSLQLRLHERLRRFRHLRRSFHATAPSLAEKSPLALHWSTPTLPPTERQLGAASWFFEKFCPRRLWTAEEWRKQNQETSDALIPEVAFLGRSNVGKSSLLNALLNRPGLNPVGPKPGKTIVMTAWGLSPTTRSGGALPGFKGDTSTRLTVLDVPGYGFKSQTPWGAEITKYLSRRKHLRKVFLLIDASHGLVAKDKDMFDLLRKQGIPHQIIACKADALLEDDGSRKPHYVETLLKIAHTSQVKDPGELLVTGAQRRKDHELSMLGISAVRWSVLRAAGLDAYAYEEFSKTNDGKSLSDVQSEANSPNPFKLQNTIYQRWVGGISKPVMGGLPYLATEDALPSQPPTRSNELPYSHPRGQRYREPSAPPRSSLRHGLDALFNPDQLISQIRSKEKPSLRLYPIADPRSRTSPSSSTSPPPSPQADPRSRTLPSSASPRTMSTPQWTSSAPRGLDALLSLTEPRRKQSPQINSRTSSRRRPSPSLSRDRARSQSLSPNSSSSSPPQAQAPPAFSSPGVSRGLDALISATQDQPSKSKGKSRSSRQGRRKFYK